MKRSSCILSVSWNRVNLVIIWQTNNWLLMLILYQVQNSSYVLFLPSYYEKQLQLMSLKTTEVAVRRCSQEKFPENMQQIYKRAPMLKRDFILWHGFSPVNLLHIYRTPFPENTPGGLLVKLTRGVYRNQPNVWDETFCKII